MFRQIKTINMKISHNLKKIRHTKHYPINNINKYNKKQKKMYVILYIWA